MEQDIKVLIVDDNETVSRITAVMLNNFKVSSNVEFAKTGKQAIDMIKSGAYGVVFMDVRMPDMDGVEITGIVVNNLLDKSPRIFGLSMYDNQFCIEKFRLAGANGYILKNKLGDFMKEATDKLINGSEFFIYN